MVAIKDMEMPNNCSECGLKSGSYCYFKKPPYNFNGINILNERASDCPLIEIEPLTDSEQRIFLSAMSREMSICKQIDNDKVDDSTVKKLVPIVNTIERKIKKVLWN